MGKRAGAGAALGVLAGLALAPVTGGVSLGVAAGLGATAGATAGAVGDMTQKAKAEAARLNRQLNAVNRNDIKQILPNQDMDQIRAAKNLRALQLSQRSGRASTILTEDKFGG